MIDTREIGAGSYPEPHEVIDNDDDDYDFGWDLDYADEYHELMMLGEIE